MLNASQNVFKKIVSTAGSDDFNELQGNNSIILKIIIILVSIVLIGLFFVINLDDKPYDAPDYRIVPGNIWEGPQLVADFTFPIYKPQSDYLEERRISAENSLPVFIYDETIEESMQNKLNNYITVLSEITENLNEQSDFSFPEKVILPILSLNKTQKINELKKIEKTISQYIKKVYASGFVNISNEKMFVNEISVKTAANEFRIIPVIGLTDKNLFLINAEKMIPVSITQSLQPLVLEIITKLNTPNLVFSKELTDRAIELNMKNVPRTAGYVKRGEIIVQNGERLTVENIAKINSYHSSSYMLGDSHTNLLYYFGGFGHSTLILSILLLYLMIIRKRIFNDNAQLAIIMVILIVTSGMAWITAQIHTQYPLELLITIPSFAMLVAIVYDSRTAFYVTVTMALLLAGIRGNDYITGTIMIFTGGIAAYTVRDIQSRTQMYQSIFYIFLGFLITILIFGAETSLRSDEIIKNILTGFINSLMAPLLTFGVLFAIERFSNISTDLRIKEYDNLDHPLMRMLAEKAPGTYQHTLSVAMLAERCAREIGANPLLVKVGAYYHDLGKMSKSEYFTENQIGIDNKHDLIQSKRSAKIIIEHIAEGIRLAHEYKLPQRIIDFIPMHHGTTLVKHFYAKALEIAENKDDVKETDFRYPGPKPKTKETAILMICDFAEAISRLEAKTTEEIEAIIEKNIHDRVTDGQFDECEITLYDLSRIKKIIAKNIIGMTHKRVSYKEIPKSELK
jgi:putative nucleotidyltransferase with HDIG domain